MKRAKGLSRGKSAKEWKKGMKVHSLNRTAPSMRGGRRL